MITLFYGDRLFDSQGPCTDKKKNYNKWDNLWYLVSPQWNLVSFLGKLVKWTTLLILNFTTFFKTCRCFFFLLFFGLLYEFCHDMWRKGGLDSLQEGVFLWCQWAGIFFWITDWQAKYHTISSARNERLSRDNRRYKGQQKFEDFNSLLFLKLISALILA